VGLDKENIDVTAKLVKDLVNDIESRIPVPESNVFTAESGYESGSDSTVTKSSFDVDSGPKDVTPNLKGSLPDWRNQTIVHNDWKNVKVTPKSEQLCEDCTKNKSKTTPIIKMVLLYLILSVLAVFFLIRYEVLTIESVPVQYRAYVQTAMNDVFNVVDTLKHQCNILVGPFIEKIRDSCSESGNILQKAAGNLANDANQIIQKFIDLSNVFLETLREHLKSFYLEFEKFEHTLKELKYVSVPTKFEKFLVYVKSLIQMVAKFDIEVVKGVVLEKWNETKDILRQEIKISVGNCVLIGCVWLASFFKAVRA
jgi:hypothetical protein